MLDKRKEAIPQKETAYIALDGIFGCAVEDNNGVLVAKNHKDVFLESAPPKTDSKDFIELKPSSKDLRPRIENLGKEFSENKTLRSVIVEVLSGLLFVDSKQDTESKTEVNDKNSGESSSQDKAEITDITAIDPKKFYKKYFCLFYKSKEGNKKILVLDSKLEIDKKSTKLFDRLINTSSFESARQKSEGYSDNVDKFNKFTPEVIEEKLRLDISEGKTIETSEHKAYFIYVLENAKREVYIQSPWVRFNIVGLYKEYIESALKRGVKIYIKYGLTPRNKFDKPDIDEESQVYFNELQEKYKELFHLKKHEDHSKFVICDEKFMLLGSFNWLSFGGEPRDKNNKQADNKADSTNTLRGETSAIIKNKDSLSKGKAKFK